MLHIKNKDRKNGRRAKKRAQDHFFIFLKNILTRSLKAFF